MHVIETVLPAGADLVRVAIDNLGCTEPSTSVTPRRFSPVRDSHGAVVPVLYAGADLLCALGETVFHDICDDVATPAHVFRADLLTLRASFLRTMAALPLADLTDSALTSLGYRRDEVTATAPVDYQTTRLWGQHVWDTTTCRGMIWNSRRAPDRQSFLLFLDANSPIDRARVVSRRRGLTITRPPMPLYDGDGLGEVLTAVSARNVTVVI